MYFDSVSECIDMGGHGTYVWMAYGVFVGVIIWNLVTMTLARRRMLKETRRFWRRQAMNAANQTDRAETSSEQEHSHAS